MSSDGGDFVTETRPYDPDPVRQERAMLESLEIGDVKWDDLSRNPLALRILLRNYHQHLYRFARTQADLNELTVAYESLREEKEELRVEVAKGEYKGWLLWIEIPASIVLGYGINILTTKESPNDVGWFALAAGFVILVLVRILDVRKVVDVIKRKARKEQGDAKD